MTFDEMSYLQIQEAALDTLSMGFHEIELNAIIRNKLTLPVSN